MGDEGKNSPGTPAERRGGFGGVLLNSWGNSLGQQQQQWHDGPQVATRASLVRSNWVLMTTGLTAWRFGGDVTGHNVEVMIMVQIQFSGLYLPTGLDGGAGWWFMQCGAVQCSAVRCSSAGRATYLPISGVHAVHGTDAIIQQGGRDWWMDG